MRNVRQGGIRFAGMGMTPAVKILLIANLVAYVIQNLTSRGAPLGLGPLDSWLVYNTQVAVFMGQIWRFASYMFLHFGFGHILGNMFGLWMFGSQVEALWGKRSFLIYYFVCGLGGSVLYALLDLLGVGTGGIMLGASGAIFGILLAYALNYPDNIILVAFVFPMKAKWVVLGYGVYTLLSIPGGGDGIAHAAHMGGMISGFIFMYLTIPSVKRMVDNKISGIGRSARQRRTRRKIHVVRPDEMPSGSNGPSQDVPKSPETLKIDAILDKISREGLQSLSDEEQEFLRKAGKRH